MRRKRLLRRLFVRLVPGADAGCECGRPGRGLTCRCRCERCGCRELAWVSWGAYLDKDLTCSGCGRVQDVWDC